MSRVAVLSAALLLPVAAPAEDQDARHLAQGILDKGAALFDARDVNALAATYTADAELSVVGKDQDSGTYQTQITRGRQAIERFYQDLFKEQSGATKSRNHVEFAHFVQPDLLIIHGHFRPDISKQSEIPFVQVRTKQGDRWLMMSLQLFLVSGP